MSVSLDMTVEMKQAERKLAKTYPNAAKRASMRALNLAIRKTNTQAVRRIAKETSLKQKLVRKNIKQLKASPGFLRAKLIAQAFAPNLVEFMTGPAVERSLVRKRRRGRGSAAPPGAGVRARAWGKSRVYKGTFVGRGRNSGKLLVFTRTGPTRTAVLKAVRGPSVRRTFMDEQIFAAMRSTARDTFLKELDRQVRLILSSA